VAVDVSLAAFLALSFARNEAAARVVSAGFAGTAGKWTIKR
jgi:hypothetical protein